MANARTPATDPLADLRAAEAPAGLTETPPTDPPPADLPTSLVLTEREVANARLAVVKGIRADYDLTRILHGCGMDPAHMIARVVVAALFAVAPPEEETDPDA